MDIKNTMCRLSDLTQEQIDSLRAAMPEGKYDFFAGEDAIGATPKGKWGTWEIVKLNRTIVSYDEMMQLLTGKSMDFTKADLIELAKTKTVIVKYRNGEYRIYLGGIFNGAYWCHVDVFSDDLKCMHNRVMDVMSIYTCNPHAAILDQLKGIGLTQVWERTELTPEQKEMEVWQDKMDELQAQMKVVQAQMKVVQAKL